MNTTNIENFLRPTLQNLNVIGGRGPAKSWVFPWLLIGVVIFVMFVLAFVNMYEYVFTGKCPMCGNKHDR